MKIEKRGRKVRRHVYLTREVEGAAEELLPDYTKFSGWLEQLAWERLIEEYGADAVRQAVEKVHADLEEDQRLPESRIEDIDLPA